MRPMVTARIAFGLVGAAALVALAPPVSFARTAVVSLDPARGPVGATIAVGGTGFTGASAVRVGGAPAVFTVEADDRITASVPAGAVTGPVEVDTAGGTVASADPFVVLPNIVLVMTDDQRWDTLQGMPAVMNDLVGRGVTFANTFATNPLCCPSRIAFLTGRYSHDTGVWTNSGQYGGFTSFVGDATTIATTLDGAGYDTALFGKYLNGYHVTGGYYVPPGWDRWRAFASYGSYYDYTLSLDGSGTEAHGSLPEDYSTDVLAANAEAFIRTASAQDPLFVWFAPLGPHAPYTPAPRHVGVLAGIAPWRPPSYDEADVSDKPAYMAALLRLTTDAQAQLDAVRQQQLEALLSVDEAVARLEQALADTGRLGDTIVVFTSDNGFLWGEHRRTGKVVPYEESIRIPLVIRWDRLPATPRIDTNLVLNLDLPGTLAEAAGTQLPGTEGRSMLPLLEGTPTSARSGLLLEHYGPGAPSYCGIRTKGAAFVHYATGEEEYYRLGKDPYERTNRIASARWVAQIATLRDIARARCVPLPPDMPPF